VPKVALLHKDREAAADAVAKPVPSLRHPAFLTAL
jgi:hypothetical protein